MNPIDQLKTIAMSQKTISSGKLLPMLEKIEKMYINQGQRISSQRNQLNKANSINQNLRIKLEKKKALTENYENLKIHHRNLTREYNLLLDKERESRLL